MACEQAVCTGFEGYMNSKNTFELAICALATLPPRCHVGKLLGKTLTITDEPILTGYFHLTKERSEISINHEHL